MKKLVLLVIFFAFIFSGCDKSDPVADQLEKDKALIEEYLIENNLTAQSTETGLYYIIENEGTGTRPVLTSYVKVDYTGKLLDGTVFDSGTVYDYPLYGYIQGWQEGIPLFKAGGNGKLFIPSNLGYGSTSKTNIPANSVLVFDIKLVNVRN